MYVCVVPVALLMGLGYKSIMNTNTAPRLLFEAALSLSLSGDTGWNTAAQGRLLDLSLDGVYF